ncbi:hypothetical protein N0824_02613 [Microcystis sp. 0824]|nr:hypothetical protein N0824_02613 [Microcystis sp. 0824]
MTDLQIFGDVYCLSSLGNLFCTTTYYLFGCQSFPTAAAVFLGFFVFLAFLRTNELRSELVFDKNYVYSSLPQVKLITWVINHWHLIA